MAESMTSNVSRRPGSAKTQRREDRAGRLVTAGRPGVVTPDHDIS